MNRRGFLGMLAGAALATVALRTGLAQTKLPTVPLLKAMDGDFDTAALRFTDKDAWYIVTSWDDEPAQMYIVTDQQIEELPAEQAMRFRAYRRLGHNPENWRGVYGANS